MILWGLSDRLKEPFACSLFLLSPKRHKPSASSGAPGLPVSTIFFSLLPFCRFLLFVSSPFQLVFPFAKGGRDGSAASYIVSKHGRGIVTPPPLSLTPTIPVPCPFCCPPTTIHPELEWARGGQLLGLQLICAPPWKAFIGSMPHATHDGHTHTRTLLWFCRARLSCSSQAGGWSPSQLQPLPA